MTLLLFIEYSFFHQQAHKMLELRDDYRNYVTAVKKILDDYNKIKERYDADADEKKNDDSIATDCISYYCNDDSDTESDVFVVVNRDLSYLKKEALAHFKEQQQAALFQDISDDMWLNYTDYVLKKADATIKSNAKQIKSNNPAKKVRSSRSRKVVTVPVARKDKSDICFSWPVDPSLFWLSSRFGFRKKPDGSGGFHYGVDMAALRGTPVKAVASGMVVEARYSKGYGKTIVVVHNRKYKTRYAHLDRIHVHVGQKVMKDSVIGKVGSTGFVRKVGKDASHLHFEVYAFNKRVNPLYFLHA